MKFTKLPISWMIALGTLVSMVGCAKNQLVADVSATWSVPNRDRNHTDALNLIYERLDDAELDQTNAVDITVEIHTPDTLQFRITTSDAQLVQHRELLKNTEYTEDLEDPQITDFPAWHMYTLSGSTEDSGDITIRHRIFVSDNFIGYNSMTDEARADLARGLFAISYSALGYPASAHFYFPDLGGFPDDDNE